MNMGIDSQPATPLHVRDYLHATSTISIAQMALFCRYCSSPLIDSASSEVMLKLARGSGFRPSYAALRTASLDLVVRPPCTLPYRTNTPSKARSSSQPSQQAPTLAVAAVAVRDFFGRISHHSTQHHSLTGPLPSRPRYSGHCMYHVSC
jgi:hypothetical protein